MPEGVYVVRRGPSIDRLAGAVTVRVMVAMEPAMDVWRVEEVEESRMGSTCCDCETTEGENMGCRTGFRRPASEGTLAGHGGSGTAWLSWNRRGLGLLERAETGWAGEWGPSGENREIASASVSCYYTQVIDH